MNEIKIFTNENFGEVGAVELEGNTWFIARDVCRALELDNSRQAISRYDLVLQNPDLISTSLIAKDYGLSGKALNKILHELGIQFNQGGVWLLYAKYQDKGYTSTKTTVFPRTDGTQGLSILTKWTQKGRLFLYDILKANGYIPLVERG